MAAFNFLILAQGMHRYVPRKTVFAFHEAYHLDTLEMLGELCYPFMEEPENRMMDVDRLGGEKKLHAISASVRMTGQRPSPAPPSRRISKRRTPGHSAAI